MVRCLLLSLRYVSTAYTVWGIKCTAGQVIIGPFKGGSCPTKAEWVEEGKLSQIPVEAPESLVKYSNW